MTKHIVWVPVLSLLVSCGTLRKNKKTTRQETKTEQSTERTVSTAGTKDSAGATYRTVTDSTSTQIEFEPDSGPVAVTADTTVEGKAVGVKTPVNKPAVGNTVVIRPDGTIEATGSIKKVKTARKQTAAAGDSARVRESRVVNVQEKQTEKAEVTVQEKTKQVKRSTAWYLYALGLIIVIGIGLYIDYRTGGYVLWAVVSCFRRRKSSNDRAG